jgi:hypothetical protein
MTPEQELDQELEKVRSLLDKTNLTESARIELLIKHKIPIIQPIILSQLP